MTVFPSGDILLMVLFELALYKLPDASNARPAGELRPVLTNVDTTPAISTFSMLLADVLDKYRLPAASKAMYFGLLIPELTYEEIVGVVVNTFTNAVTAVLDNEIHPLDEFLASA